MTLPSRLKKVVTQGGRVLSVTATGKTLFPAYGTKVIGGVRTGYIGLTLKDTPTIVTPMRMPTVSRATPRASR